MSRRSVRERLAEHGLLARRDLGQNFLVDEAVAERLAGLAGVAEHDRVIEIGTGLGILTRALARRAAHVTTLEVDAGLVRLLRAEQELPANVSLVHADALRIDLTALAREERGGEAPSAAVRVVGNLPYSIASPLLRRLLDARAELAGWAVMVQREVADRLLAPPGTRAYGSLAVLHRLCVGMERSGEISPGCFQPVPRVRSSFVRMTPLEEPMLGCHELGGVERVVRAAFGHRRKTLVNALRRRGVGVELGLSGLERVLEGLGIERRARAETLAPERLLALARALFALEAGARRAAEPRGAVEGAVRGRGGPPRAGE